MMRNLIISFLNLFARKKEKQKSTASRIRKVRLDGERYTLFDFKFGRPYKLIDDNDE